VTWAPGTVAVATVWGVPNVRVIAYHDDFGDWHWFSSIRAGAGRFHEPDQVTDVRPLVVLDPEKFSGHLSDSYEDGVETAIQCLRETGSRVAGLLADQIEAQTKPPKPEEPLGLGAVVEDAEGQVWVRFKTAEIRPWRRNWPGDDVWSSEFFSDIDAVRVLSEGVAP